MREGGRREREGRQKGGEELETERRERRETGQRMQRVPAGSEYAQTQRKVY